jgi:hypothetical protein
MFFHAFYSRRLMIKVWAVLSLAACAPLQAAEHSIAGLRQMIEAAVTGKAARVVLPPGVYRGAPENNGKIGPAMNRPLARGENVKQLDGGLPVFQGLEK